MRRVPSGPVRKGNPAAERRRLGRLIAIAAVALPLVLARAASLGGADQLWVSLLAALGFGAAAVLPVRYFRPKTALVAQLAVGVVVAGLIFGAWWHFTG